MVMIPCGKYSHAWCAHCYGSLKNYPGIHQGQLGRSGKASRRKGLLGGVLKDEFQFSRTRGSSEGVERCQGHPEGGTQRPEVSERAGPVLGAGVWSRELRGRVVMGIL